MNIKLTPAVMRDPQTVKLGNGNLNDFRISLPPKAVVDPGKVKLGSGNVNDLRTN